MYKKLKKHSFQGNPCHCTWCVSFTGNRPDSFCLFDSDKSTVTRERTLWWSRSVLYAHFGSQLSPPTATDASVWRLGHKSCLKTHLSLWLLEGPAASWGIRFNYSWSIARTSIVRPAHVTHLCRAVLLTAGLTPLARAGPTNCHKLFRGPWWCKSTTVTAGDYTCVSFRGPGPTPVNHPNKWFSDFNCSGNPNVIIFGPTLAGQGCLLLNVSLIAQGCLQL